MEDLNNPHIVLKHSVKTHLNLSNNKMLKNLVRSLKTVSIRHVFLFHFTVLFLPSFTPLISVMLNT